VVSSPQSDLRPRLAQAIVGNNWELLELRSVSMSLEDVFLRVTSAEEPMQEPDEADVYVEGEDEAYEEQEIAYEEVADDAAAEAEAEATAAAEAEAAAAQSGPAQGRGRKGGRK
jgi:peptidoglycan hydrolase CwlO-like protein